MRRTTDTLISQILVNADASVIRLVALADDSLVLGQRNSEWCGHGPMLEQDIAISNIALDLIGQARLLYQAAARLMDDQHDEDSLAFLRTADEYLNLRLVEQENGDWAQTMLRQYLFSSFQQLRFRQYAASSDAILRPIAAKSLKEIDYHVRWSSEWVIRLGDGTPESHGRLMQALDLLWPYTAGLFEPSLTDHPDIPMDADQSRKNWLSAVSRVFDQAGINMPVSAEPVADAGREGTHGPELYRLLQEMQQVHRDHPGATW